MWWDRIIEWFSNSKERNIFLKDFNDKAKDLFISNAIPIFFKAESCIGNSSFRHQFSRWPYHGFRIRAMSGMYMRDEAFIQLGQMIASSSQTTRKLVTLGYDTLEVTNSNNQIVQQWRLTALLELGG